MYFNVKHTGYKEEEKIMSLVDILNDLYDKYNDTINGTEGFERTEVSILKKQF